MTFEESQPDIVSAAFIAPSRGSVANLWEEVVQALLVFPDFLPEFWGHGETEAVPFTRDSPSFEPFHFTRRTAPAYQMYEITKRGIRGLYVETSGPLAGRYEQFFALSDALAAAARVEYGYLQPRWKRLDPAVPRPRGRAVSNIHHLQCDGPPGICLRTWFGPHIAKLIGEERIRGCGAVTTELPWGGFRIDIVAAPWTVNVEILAEQLNRVEGILAQAEVFGDSSKAPSVCGKNWVKIPRGD